MSAQVVDRFNEKLAPHGIKCQDMTLVVERAVEQKRLELIVRIYEYARKNTSRAVIIFNTPATWSYLLLIVRRVGMDRGSLSTRTTFTFPQTPFPSKSRLTAPSRS